MTHHDPRDQIGELLVADSCPLLELIFMTDKRRMGSSRVSVCSCMPRGKLMVRRRVCRRYLPQL